MILFRSKYYELISIFIIVSLINSHNPFVYTFNYSLIPLNNENNFNKHGNYVIILINLHVWIMDTSIKLCKSLRSGRCTCIYNIYIYIHIIQMKVLNLFSLLHDRRYILFIFWLYVHCFLLFMLLMFMKIP